jgi:hypothetical protein
MKKTGNLIPLAIITAFFVNACNSAPVNQLKSIQDNTQVFYKSRTSIKGIAEFPKKNSPALPGFSAKATTAEISPGALVSIINPADNTTVATGLTDGSGVFTINPAASFQPAENQVFILEAAKRLGGLGVTLLSIRTYIRWNSNSWSSMTGSTIKINSKTTALAIIASQNPGVPAADFINKIDSSTGDVTGVNGQITPAVVAKVDGLVDLVLNKNEDPFKRVNFSNGEYFISNTLTEIVAPAGDVVLYKNSVQEFNPDTFEIDITDTLKMVSVNGNNNTSIITVNSNISFFSLSADRTRIIYQESIPNSGDSMIKSVSIAGGTPITLASGEIGGTPYASPDGKKAYFVILGAAAGVYTTDGTLENTIKVSTGINSTSFNTTLYAWSPDSTKLAVAAYIGSRYELFIMNADGSGTKYNLTENVSRPANSTIPFGKWSPDSKKVAFRVGDATANKTNYYVTTLTNNVPGSPVQLSDNTGINDTSIYDNYHFSPDSSKLSWWVKLNGNPEYDYYVANTDGTNRFNLTGHITSTGYTGSGWPNWSPDSTKLGLQLNDGAGYDAYSASVSSANSAVKVSKDIGTRADTPFFSKNGAKAIFTIFTNSPNTDYLYAANLADTPPITPVNLTSAATHSYLQSGTGSLHPTNDKFLFRRDNALYMMNSDGTGITALTAAGAVGAQKWFPDGNSLLYSFNNDLWVVNTSTLAITQLTNSPDETENDALLSLAGS